MACEDNMFGLEYDVESGASLDLGDNLVCGDNGLEYTGAVVPSIKNGEPCTPTTPQDCNSIKKDCDTGELWREEMPCYIWQREVFTGNAGGVTLPPDGVWFSNPLRVEEPANPSSCYKIFDQAFVSGWMTVQTADTIMLAGSMNLNYGLQINQRKETRMQFSDAIWRETISWEHVAWRDPDAPSESKDLYLAFKSLVTDRENEDDTLQIWEYGLTWEYFGFTMREC